MVLSSSSLNDGGGGARSGEGQVTHPQSHTSCWLLGDHICGDESPRPTLESFYSWRCLKASACQACDIDLCLGL